MQFARNVLARVPKGHQDVVAAALRTVFVHPNPKEISAAWDRTADMFARQFPKVKELMDTAKVDVLRSARSRRIIGARSGRTTRSRGSTKRTRDAPTLCRSSRIVQPRHSSLVDRSPLILFVRHRSSWSPYTSSR